MASPHCASGAEDLRPTTVSHMPHRCSSAHDVLLGPHPGTKCLSQARHTCHRAELSTRMELDLKSCPWTPAAPKGPPPPPFRTNNLVRSRVRSSPASHHGTGISVSRQGAPTLPRRSTQPRLRRSHYPAMRGRDETTNRQALVPLLPRSQSCATAGRSARLHQPPTRHCP